MTVTVIYPMVATIFARHEVKTVRLRTELQELGLFWGG